MKCPNCKSDSLTELTTSQPTDSELREWDYFCTECEWEGVESETIRTEREIASAWMFGYIIARQHLEGYCFLHEMWGDEETERHIDFVELCMSKGIKPTHFVDKMIEDYEAHMDMACELTKEIDLDDDDDDGDEWKQV